MKVPTFRVFSIVAYDDSESLNINQILNILVELNYKYFYICHDKDIDSDGIPKKLHYHIAVYFDKPTTIKKIANDLNIDENRINVKDDNGNRYTLKNTLGYFLHFKMKDKFNYQISDIFGNCDDLVNKYYNIISDNDSEKRELKSIIAFIEDNKVDCMKELFSYCIDNNYVNTLKKYQYLFSIMIRER